MSYAETGRAWTFTVPGTPVPKARPRVDGGHARTPQKTVAYERLVCDVATLAGVRPGASPVAVEVRAFFPDRRTRDGDNVIKSVLDGLVGQSGRGVIIGDSWTNVPIHTLVCGLDKVRPRLEITVRELREVC